jgi:hypothetical protein
MGQANATGSFGGAIAVTKPTEGQISTEIFYHSPTRRTGYIAVEGYEKPFGSFPIRYNIYSDQLEIIQGGVPINLPTEKVASFTYVDSTGHQDYFIADDHFISIDERSKTKFYQQLFSGNRASLYRNRAVKIVKQQFNPLDVNGSTEPKVSIVETFYVEKEKKLFKFTSKKELILLLESDAVDKFMKEQKTDLRNEQDLVRLFVYYNEKQ